MKHALAGVIVCAVIGCDRPESARPQAPAPSVDARVTGVDRPDVGQRDASVPLTPSSVAGLYAVRRTGRSTSCPQSGTGEIASTIWVLDAMPTPDHLKLSVYGATSFTQFSASITGSTVQLAASSQSDIFTTMAVELRPSGERQLVGIETVNVMNADLTRCVVQRDVVATRLN